MSGADYIPVSEVAPECLDITQVPQSKPLPNNPQQTQTRGWYSYQYPGKATRSDALFELQICQGNIAMTKDEASGNVIWKLNLRISDPADQQGCRRLDQGRVRAIAKHRQAFKVFSFTAENPGDIRTIIFEPRDDQGNPTGGEPIMSLKINDKSQFKSIIDMEGNTTPVDYQSLKGASLQCSVIFHLWNDYKGSSMNLPSPQIYVRSCLVLGVSQNGEVNHTKSEKVNQFLQQNPEMLDTIAAQIEELKALRAQQEQQKAKTQSLLTPAPPVNQNPQMMNNQMMGQGMTQEQINAMGQTMLPPLPQVNHVGQNNMNPQNYMNHQMMGQSMNPQMMGQSMNPQMMGQSMNPQMMGQSMNPQMMGQGMVGQPNPMSSSQRPIDLTAHLSGAPGQGGLRPL